MDSEKEDKVIRRESSGVEKKMNTRFIASKAHAAGVHRMDLPPSSRGGQDTLCCFMGKGEDRKEIQKILKDSKNHYMFLHQPMSELVKDDDNITEKELETWIERAEPVPLVNIKTKQWGELGADFPIFFQLVKSIACLNLFLFLIIGLPCFVTWSGIEGRLDLANIDRINVSFVNATRCDLTGTQLSFDTFWCSTTLIHIEDASWMLNYVFIDGILVQGFLHFCFFVLYTMIKTDINEISHETEFLTEASYSVVAKGIPKKDTKNHYTKDEIKKKFQVWGDVLDVEVIQESRKMEKSVAIVTFENTHSHNKCLEDFKIASGDDCWNRMVRCLTCNSKAYDEALARTSFDGVRIKFIGRAPIFRNVSWDHIHIQLSDGERCQRWVVNYVYVVAVVILAYLLILWQMSADTVLQGFGITILFKLFLYFAEWGGIIVVGRVNEGDKNETSKDSMLVLTLIQLVPFCGAPLLSIFLSFIRETELGGKSTEQMSTIATTVATLLLLECTLTPILTILDIGSLIMRMINSISSACCNIMPFGPNSCWGPLKFTYESLYGPREVSLEYYYRTMLLTSVIPILFGYFFPLSYLLSAVALCFQWFSSRWAILRASAHPRYSDGRLAGTAIDLFVQWLLLRPIANLWWTLFTSSYLRDIGVIDNDYEAIYMYAILTTALLYFNWLFWNICCPFFLTCITNCTHSMLRTASDKEYDFAWPPRPLMPKRPYKRHVSRLSYQAGASEKLNSNNTIEMTDVKGTISEEASKV